MKDNLARQLFDPIAVQKIGMVVAAGGDGLRVRIGANEQQAIRAASCLVAPEVGDRVLVAEHDRGCHVIAVLDRDEAAPVRVALSGDLELSAPDGRVTLAAQHGVRVVTPGEAEVAAGSARLAALRASFAVGALSYVGEQVDVQLERVKTVARTLESVAERWVQRLERAYRFISKSEQVRADVLDYSARTAVTVQAENTVISSAELTKIDGGQIHLG